MTVDELIAFEAAIASDFEAGHIAAPVHLAGGNEQELIGIFRHIRPQDYVCGTWRTHYHCLLKGVPKDQLRKAIHDGRSINLCFAEHRIISSAIVGGIAPIALGIAWAIKNLGLDEKVWCFLGDMSVRSGIARESIAYAEGHDLPIRFVIEDNGLSVVTKTYEVWGEDRKAKLCKDQIYHYTLTWPHVGVGKWVRF